MSFNRRSFLLAGAAAGAVSFAGYPSIAKKGSDSDGGTTSSGTTSKSGLVFGYVPFTQRLYVPPILKETVVPLDPRPGNYPGVRFGDVGGPARPSTPRTPDNFNDVAHGIAPEYPGIGIPSSTPDKEYKLITKETTQQFVPEGPEVPIFAYRDANNPADPGRTPGPTVIATLNESVVLRNENHLTEERMGTNTTHHDHETSIHLHGGHLPAHADGYPDFYVLAGEARDYYYPNEAPDKTGEPGIPDRTWIPSTLWYHDHAMDVSGFNVARGLAGFYLVFDEEENKLIADEILPDPTATDSGEIPTPLDIGLAITDQVFNADGSEIVYDFFDHNGRIGEVFTVNGLVQPFVDVDQRQYRIRLLNASNARMYQIRLSTRTPMLVIGTDSWLLPEAVQVSQFQLAPGQRQDLIIDFRDTNGPEEVFLENIMIQENGRKGKEVDPDEPTPLLKFAVRQGTRYSGNDLRIEPGTVLRKFFQLIEDELRENGVAVSDLPTRTFRFDRSNGAWTVNNRFFNPRRFDAVPELGSTERWFFENSSGGWWHPIHTHLEGFQVRRLDGTRPPLIRRFNSDLVNLEGGFDAEVLVKFRTFTGPFVFHCHTIEHEDMRMMGVHDPRPAGTDSLLDGESQIDPRVSGVVPDCIELEEEGRIFFDKAGDVDRLEDRGVGFPHCEFDLDRRGNG